MFSENEKTAVEFKTEVVPLTLELAKHFNRMPTLKGDRNPDSPKGKQRVGYLHEILRAGLFHSPVWSTVQITSEKGKKYRIDGGNSSRMLTQAGPDFPENLYVTMRYFRAPNLDAAIDLYEQFNVRISTRTQTDLIKNRSAYIKKLQSVPITSIKTAIWGISTHYKLRNPDEDTDVLDFIKLYPEFINWSSHFTTRRWLRRSGVVGAMYSMWILSESLSEDFWGMVKEETSLTPKCPTRILAKFLQVIIHDRNKMIQWSKRAIYVKCHHAWNAWRDGNSTMLKYLDGCPLPNPK